MNKILLAHPMGNTFVRGLLAGLQKHNLLHSFHTSIACFEGGFSEKLSNHSVFKELSKRNFSATLRRCTITYPYMELGRIFARKFGINSWLTHEQGRFCVDKVYSEFDNLVANYLKKHQNIDAAYCYEDGALSTFRQAKTKGIKCIYDLPIAYWEYGTRLMKEEAERLPKWAITLGGGIADSDEKHARKVEELELADAVVVPSSFVRNSLPERMGNKLIVEAPFGTPERTVIVESEKKKSGKLRVLFVGSMGQRKGLGDLFEAIKIANNKNIELIVMGSLLAPMDFYRKQLPDFTYETTRPHSQVLELMKTCDVFCLPSIVEGRALVMQEAMSQGLPIIITPNTGGEDLVVEGKTGFLIPARSPEQIAEKLDWFFHNRHIIRKMGEMSQIHAATYTWEKYGYGIVNFLQKHL